MLASPNEFLLDREENISKNWIISLGKMDLVIDYKSGILRVKCSVVLTYRTTHNISKIIQRLRRI